MKRLFKLLPVVFVCVVALSILPKKIFAQYNYSLAIPAQNAPVHYDNSLLSYNDFYQDLEPYGKWIDDENYGYVWSPDVEVNFRPYYTNGHWAMTNYGNTWISDYTWGWACFHYGRWTFDTFYGWLWVPGQNWGPAWVSWREGNGYVGWAPLSPDYDYSSKKDFSCPNDWWIFLPPKYVYSGRYYRYWFGPRNNKDILHHSNFINNTYENNQITYVGGPHASQIEDLTKNHIQVFKLINSNNLNTKTHLDVIRMYRPSEIRPVASIGGQKVVPPNAVKAPRAISKPQSITESMNTKPEFRNGLPKPGAADAVGTHFPEPKVAPQQGNNDNSYQWDTK